MVKVLLMFKYLFEITPESIHFLLVLRHITGYLDLQLDYRLPGIDEFDCLAKMEKICINVNEGTDDSFVTANYTDLANKLFNSSGNVVVLFVSLNHAVDLLTEIKMVQQNSTRHFLWIAIDSKATYKNFAEFSSIFSGIWVMIPLTTKYDV